MRIASIVGGMRISCTLRRRGHSCPLRVSAPSSISIASTSSTTSGLPPATASTGAASSAAAGLPSKSSAMSAAQSSSDRGPSEIVALASAAPGHRGCFSCSSGRALQMSSSGASERRAARCSSAASRPGAAQWMSSTTTTSGPSLDSARISATTSGAIASAAPASGARPKAPARRSAVAIRTASGSPESSFAIAAIARSGRSSCPIPAAWQVISASGQ